MAEEVSKNKRHRKEKPWDTDDIDHWKIDPFKEEDKCVLLEESSFVTLFPRYREPYLKQVWRHVEALLETKGVACDLNLRDGSMTVMTTKKACDPYVILKARDLIKLLARSVSLETAAKVLDDDMACDIVKIGNIISNKERFVKRRQRLIGPDGNTLKAIELLTKCFVMVQGNTVACIGPFRGLKEVRRIIIDCMKNIHPIYHIKTLMIKRELANDEKLKHESWDKFLPKFNKQNKKQKVAIKEKKKYTPFPPEMEKRQVDHLLESGEYFLKEDERRDSKLDKKKEQQEKKKEHRKAAKQKDFIAPQE